MTAMLMGTALALVTLAFVLYPLFREPLALGPIRLRGVAHNRTNSAVDALREIEFDHATGKLSEHDYAELKATYTQRAITAMRGAEGAVVVCDVCGLRPELDALFCSECGRSLAA
jgi:hypothetical protein